MPDQVGAALQRAVVRIRRMSHLQRVQSLKAAGIVTLRQALSRLSVSGRLFFERGLRQARCYLRASPA